MILRPDPEALLVALVLCPGTYSRNRFFSLYTDPAYARVRRRAQLLRSIITEIAQADPARRGQIVSIEDRSSETNADEAWLMVTYVVPSLGLRRTTALGSLELSLLRYALAKKAAATDPLLSDEEATRRIEGALSKLGLTLLDNGEEASLLESGDLALDEKARNPPLPSEEPER